MIVCDLDLLRPAFAPPEYDPPLIVDSDRMLAGQIASQGFQSISGWRRKIAEGGGGIELHQFAAGDFGDVARKSLWNATLLQD